VSRFLQDAVSILDTASAESDNPQSEFAILIDRHNGFRIVEGAGWQLEALRNDYHATTAFLVKRTPDSVSVTAQNGSERCDLRRSSGKGVLADLTGGVIAHHLIRREPLALNAGGNKEDSLCTSAKIPVEGYGDSRNTLSSFRTRDGSALKSGEVRGSFMNML